MIATVSIFMLIFWGSWFYQNSQEASLFLWLTVVCCTVSMFDTSVSSYVVLGIVVLFFGSIGRLSVSWQSWSEVAYFSLITLMFVAVSLILWTGDFISTLVSIEILHLTMAVILVNGRNYARMLLFLISGYILTVILLISLPLSLLSVGNLDLIDLMSSNIFICLLIIGKLYVLPWILVCILLYSGATFDLIMAMSLLFSVHYTIWLLSSLSSITNESIGLYLSTLLLISLILATFGLLNSSLINVFTGVSYCITTHFILLIGIFDTIFNQELTLLLIVLYLLLSIAFLNLFKSTGTTSLTSLEGMSNHSITHGSILALVICGYMGLPPSLFFILKTGILYQTYLILPAVYVLLVIISILVSYCYIRLFLRLFMESKSTIFIVTDRSSSLLTSGSIFLLIITLFYIL